MIAELRKENLEYNYNGYLFLASSITWITFSFLNTLIKNSLSKDTREVLRTIISSNKHTKLETLTRSLQTQILMKWIRMQRELARLLSPHCFLVIKTRPDNKQVPRRVYDQLCLVTVTSVNWVCNEPESWIPFGQRDHHRLSPGILFPSPVQNYHYRAVRFGKSCLLAYQTSLLQ